MPNWASTSYRIEADDSSLLEKISKAICDMKPVTEDADQDWEGNVLVALGKDLKDVENKYMRGFISFVEMEDNVLHIDANEAWGTTDFKDALLELFPGLRVYYVTEEPGMEVYRTNDSEGIYFADRFVIDSSVDGDWETEYFEDKEEALEYIADILELNKKFNTIEEAEDAIDEWKSDEYRADDDFINIHEFTITD